MAHRSRIVVALALLAACSSTCALDDSVLYACDANEPRCPDGLFCAADQICRPLEADGGAGGGLTAGGSAGGASGGSAGASGGGAAGGAVVGGGGGGLGGGESGGVAGGQSGGSAGGTVCVPLLCGALDCGYRADGCGGTLQCGRCSAGTECGVRTANRCDLVPGLCTPEGICWENLLPQGNDIRALYSTDERHTWLATDNGSVLFFDGERTTMLPVPTQAGFDLRAVHGRGPNDLYVVGDNATVLHFDGGTWATETLPGIVRPDLTFVQCLGAGTAVTGRNEQQIYLRDPSGTWANRNAPLPSGTHRALQHLNQLYLINENGVLMSVTSSSWQPVQGGDAQLAFVRAFMGVGQKLYALGSVDGGPLPDGGPTTLSRLREFPLPTGPWTTLVDVPGDALTDQVNGFDTLDGDEFWLAGSLNGVRRFRRDAGLTPRLLSQTDTRTLFAVKALGPNRAFFTGSTGTYVHVEDGGASTTAHPAQRLSGVNKLCISPMATLSAPAILAPQNSNSNLTREVGPPVRWPTIDSPNVARSTNWVSCAISAQGDFIIAGTDGGLAFGTSTLPGSATTPANYGVLDWTRVWTAPSKPWYLLSSPRAGATYLLITDGGLTGASSSLIELDAGFLDLFGTGPYGAMVGQGGRQATLSSTGHFVTQPGPTTTTMNAVHGAVQRDGGMHLFVAAGVNGGWWSRVNTNAFVNQPAFSQATFTGVWVSAHGSTYFVGGPPDGGVAGGWLYVRAPGGVVTAEPLPLVGAPSSIVGLDDFDGGTSTVWVSGRAGAILRRGPKDGG